VLRPKVAQERVEPREVGLVRITLKRAYWKSRVLRRRALGEADVYGGDGGRGGGDEPA
jgi:hypothetical protein